MENHQNDLSSIQSIALQLRVPELKYRIDSSAGDEQQIHRFFELSRSSPQVFSKLSLTKAILKEFAQTPLPRKFNNLAFITDRFFDNWLRKNNLAIDLNNILGRWRLPFFEALYHQQNEKAAHAFVLLLDTMASDCFGWCPFPARSRSVLLDCLSELEGALFSAEAVDPALLKTLLNQWNAYEAKQQQKYQKVVSRLIEVERRSSVSRYAKVLAQNYLNQTFRKRLVTDSLRKFLESYWLDCLSLVFQDIPAATSLIECAAGTRVEQAKTLTQNMLIVFCRKGEGAFKSGDSLIDELAQFIECHNSPPVPDATWSELEQDILRILQNKPVDEKLYRELASHDDLSQFDTPAGDKPDCDLWFSARADGCEQRVQIARVFDDSKHLLLCNYAGMKFDTLSFKEFQQATQQGDFKVISSDASLSQVIEVGLAGLHKVALAQRDARIKAAEKAKREAEQLLAEKQKSDDEAHVRATEIAERTRSIQLKREEKQRFQRESEVYQVLSGFKLGGWISVAEDSACLEERQRYKLAVKLAATGKYIFVDKLGVKKKQYTAASLVDGIIRGEVEILSQGSEFKDDLERVLSRMKMSK